jgi:hypothetical protein
VDWRGAERTSFAEASSYHAAAKKVAAAVGALEHRSPVAVEERVYNCYSAQDCIDEGLSADTRAAPFRNRLERRRGDALRDRTAVPAGASGGAVPPVGSDSCANGLTEMQWETFGT